MALSCCNFATFTGLFTSVEIAQADVVLEATDEFKTHDTKTIYKGPLGEEGIRNDYITQFQQLLFIVM